jgi:acetolactate synthase-1/2/3 large subunit
LTTVAIGGAQDEGPDRAFFIARVGSAGREVITMKQQKGGPAKTGGSRNGMEMTGAEMVVQALIDQGVEHVFGYPGGAVLPIYDELIQQDRLTHILVRHEQGAGHAAEGYARSTGKPGVALVTSGPGATNMVTPLTDALMDSIPIVCLTGQVPTHLIGNDAFQECDTVGITRPATKHNWLVRDVNDLSRIIHEAFYVATHGRPGPVLVDIPKDVQFATGVYTGPSHVEHKTYHPRTKGDAKAIRAAVDLIAKAKKPIFYTGGGVVNSGPRASALLRELVRLTGYPITSTLMGLGAYPASDRQWLGMLGMHGTYEANNAMHDCDLMVAIGARFDDRITGRVDAFSPGSKKIHIDIDASSINKNIRVDLPIVGDVAEVLEDLLIVWKAEKPKIDQAALKSWWKEIDHWRARHCLAYRQNRDVIMPQYAIERLFASTRDKDVYITTEVGQHQMWAAQFFRFEEPNRWMTSGGLGTMGYGLPAAVGVQVAHRDSLVIDIAGDASVLMTIQEISTAVQHDLPIKIFILNNQYMGMVRQWQQLLHGNRLAHSYTEALPDFVKLAEAYGCVGIRASKPAELDGAIEQMIKVKQPVIFDCRVANLENCFPMIPSGKAHNQMLLPAEANDETTATAFAGGKALV